MVLLGMLAPAPLYAQLSPQQEVIRNEALQAKAQAADIADEQKPDCNILSAGFGCVLYWILDALTDFIVDFFVSIAAVMFDATVNLAMAPLSTLTFVQVGFNITLGVANMFFVLILLWIAIATIFDFGEFTARQLLPRLIVAALLINFSLAIGSSIINLSNGIASVFYKKIQTVPLEQQSFLPGAPIASKVMALSKFAVLKGTQPKTSQPATEGELATQIQQDCSTTGTGIFGTISCLYSITDSLWRWTFNMPAREADILSTAFKAVFFKLLITPILIFVLLAGAIFLIVRTISLAFLLILGPLAFLFMILPYTRAYYNQWWEGLMKWSFFFPAFMFFIFLSLQAGGQFASMFVVGGADDKLGAMVQYLMIAGLLIGSLIAANKMGIQGASTVTGWGKKMAAGTGRWAKGTGKIAVGTAAGIALGSRTGQRMAQSRVGRTFLRPVEATVAAGKKVQEAREKAALQRRMMAGKASPAYTRSLLRGMTEPERQDFFKELKGGQLKKTVAALSPEERRRYYLELKKIGQEDKLTDALDNLTQVVETETGAFEGSPQFQEAFNGWVAGATTGELQKRISAEDIRTNTYLHEAIKTKEVIGLSELKTIAHTGEKGEALRQHVIDLGDRAQFENERTVGYSEVEASERALARAISKLQTTNPQLAKDLTTPAVQVNLPRGRPLGRKTGPPVIVVQQAAATPPP